eukprot:8964181-Heterocapsa_arctica.AAC.1
MRQAHLRIRTSSLSLLSSSQHADRGTQTLSLRDRCRASTARSSSGPQPLLPRGRPAHLPR